MTDADSMEPGNQTKTLPRNVPDGNSGYPVNPLYYQRPLKDAYSLLGVYYETYRC